MRKPEEKRYQEERPGDDERKKKPYTQPELTKHGPVAEMTGPDVSKS